MIFWQLVTLKIFEQPDVGKGWVCLGKDMERLKQWGSLEFPVSCIIRRVCWVPSWGARLIAFAMALPVPQPKSGVSQQMKSPWRRLSEHWLQSISVSLLTLYETMAVSLGESYQVYFRATPAVKDWLLGVLAAASQTVSIAVALTKKMRQIFDFDALMPHHQANIWAEPKLTYMDNCVHAYICIHA